MNHSRVRKNKGIFSNINFPNASNLQIDTEEFLNAAKKVVKILERWTDIFAVVISDLNANIEKVQTFYAENVDSNKHLKDLLLNAKRGNNYFVINASKWIRRNLQFVLELCNCVFKSLRFKKEHNKPLEKLLKCAYCETLMLHNKLFDRQLHQVFPNLDSEHEDFAPNSERKTGSYFKISELRKFNKSLREFLQALVSIELALLFT